MLPGELSGDRVGEFLASLIFFPAVGALAVLLLHAIVLDWTENARVARWTAVLLGAATMHWELTVNNSEESQVAVCVLAVVWAGQRAWSLPGLRWPIA